MHLTEESLRSEENGSEVTASFNQEIASPFELTYVDNEARSQDITFRDQMNSNNRHDKMLLKLRAAIVSDETSESNEECVTESIHQVLFGVQNR